MLNQWNHAKNHEPDSMGILEKNTTLESNKKTHNWKVLGPLPPKKGLQII